MLNKGLGVRERQSLPIAQHSDHRHNLVKVGEVKYPFSLAEKTTLANRAGNSEHIQYNGELGDTMTCNSFRNL